VLYDIYITFFDGSSEYLLGEWDNIPACLAELRGFKEYEDIERIIIEPKEKELSNVSKNKI